MKAAVEEKNQKALEKQKAEEQRIQEVYKLNKAQGEAKKEKQKEREKSKKVSQVFRTG